MYRRLAAFPLVLGLALLFGLFANSGEAQQTDPAKDDQEKVTSTAQKGSPAARIDFRKELSLPYPSLGTLGSRIDAARRGHEPVTLAHAANELAVAEQVAGKKASLTSSALIQESAELAKLRKEAKELQAVERVATQVGAENDLVMNLKKQIALYQQGTKAETDAVRRNEQPTDTPRRVLVNNYTTQYVDLWVNGYMKMQIGPGESKWCVIEHKWNPTVLTAYGDGDNTNWGPRYIWGRFKTYTWNLN